MKHLPCEGCRGLCCGPVPVTEREVKKIKKHLRSMPDKLRLELRNQKRYFGTCIFYDLERDRCGIHNVRPQICKAFGYHKNLVCVRDPNAVTKGLYEPEEPHIGTLSIDITWNDFR